MAEILHEQDTGSVMTFEKSGTAVAPHVWNLGPAGAVSTGSESFLFGQASGTSDWVPLMAESGTATDPRRLVVSAAVDSVFQASGNVFMVSGNNWAGTGSVFSVGGGVISTDNSTSSTLIANGSFFGTGEDVSNYRTVSVQVFADESSTQSGLTFQFSTDNTNWDAMEEFTLTSGASTSTRRFQIPIHAQYFRIGYTNDTSAQGAFRLQTILHPGNTLTTIHRLDEDIVGDRSSQLVRAGLLAQKPDTTFTSIDATAGGNLKVAVEEFDASLPAGTNFIGNISGNVSNLGSVAITNTPSTDTFIVSGNAWDGVGSAFIAGGSVNVSNMLGSVAVTSQAIGSIYGIGIGSVYAETLGSVAVTTNPLNTDIRPRMIGSPGWVNATATTSGTYSANVWVVPTNSGAGITGWDISSDTAMLVRLVFSGATPTLIAQYRFPASGTVVRNLLHMISGADAQNVGVGLGAAGNVDVSIYGMNVT